MFQILLDPPRAKAARNTAQGIKPTKGTVSGSVGRNRGFFRTYTVTCFLDPVLCPAVLSGPLRLLIFQGAAPNGHPPPRHKQGQGQSKAKHKQG